MVTSLVLAIAAALSSQPLPPGCVWVRAENDAAGAGFVVDRRKKLLVTCRHVVADRKKVDVFFPWYRDRKLETSRDEYLGHRVHLRERGLLVTGTVLRTSDELDLALLELESIPDAVNAIELASRSPGPGEPLRVVGNRFDLETVWNITTGPVRVRGRLADGYFWRGKKLAANAHVLIGQLPTDEGDSGGPVFDSRGRVVGMASALRRQSPLAAVCIDASEIRRFAALSNPAKDQQTKASLLAGSLIRATVWVQPTANDIHRAGVLIEPDLVLTCGKGIVAGDCVGVGFPVRKDENWNHDRATYRDGVCLALRGCWRSARVLAVDRTRDLALLRLDSSVAGMRPVSLATRLPDLGESLHAMSHPGGLEFAWVYASGSVRQRGRVSLTLGDGARRVGTLVCQLPAQSGSPGGAVLNDRGELVGILSRKESPQMVAYAVTAEEIADFLDVSLLELPARSLRGLITRIESLPERLSRSAARALAERADKHRQEGKRDDAERDAVAALAFDSTCARARLCRAKMSLVGEALAELDLAVEQGPFDREVHLLRAELAANTKDWRKARGDLEHILHANPVDADARQRLVPILLELNKDEEAAAAVRDTIRADPQRHAKVAADLLAQADAIAKKYPDSPAVAASWLVKAMTAARRDEFAEVLRRAAIAKDDRERLNILRAALKM